MNVADFAKLASETLIRKTVTQTSHPSTAFY